MISYSRVSNEKGDESYSHGAQHRVCSAYAEAHGHTVVATYEDTMTGMTLERPGWLTVLQLLADGKAEGVVVYRLDRVARKTGLVHLALDDQLAPLGAVLHLPSLGRAVDPELQSDLFLVGIEALVSQAERQNILQRTRDGRNEKMASGVWLGTGTTLYWLEKTGTKRQTTLTLDPDGVAVVQELLRLYLDGMGVRDIARHLTVAGHPTPSMKAGRLLTGRAWSPESVRRILRDERLVGVFWQNRRASGGKLKPKEERIKLELPHLALIERGTWDYIQSRIDHNSDKWTFAIKEGNQYLLSGGRLRCACGGATRCVTHDHGGKGRPHSYYRCDAKGHQRRECAVPTLRASAVDAAVWADLEHFLANPEFTLEQLRAVQSREQYEHQDAAGLLASYERIAARIKAEIDRLYDDYREGLLDRDGYKERRKAQEARLGAADDVRRDAEAALAARVLRDRDVEQIVSTATTLGELLAETGNLEFSDKRKAIEVLGIGGQLWWREDGELMLNVTIRNVPVITKEAGELAAGEAFGGRNGGHRGDGSGQTS
nr:recombinase family protein [Oscillochloris sp. ZM17-4]